MLDTVSFSMRVMLHFNVVRLVNEWRQIKKSNPFEKGENQIVFLFLFFSPIIRPIVPKLKRKVITKHFQMRPANHRVREDTRILFVIHPNNSKIVCFSQAAGKRVSPGTNKSRVIIHTIKIVITVQICLSCNVIDSPNITIPRILIPKAFQRNAALRRNNHVKK